MNYSDARITPTASVDRKSSPSIKGWAVSGFSAIARARASQFQRLTVTSSQTPTTIDPIGLALLVHRQHPRPNPCSRMRMPRTSEVVCVTIKSRDHCSRCHHVFLGQSGLPAATLPITRRRFCDPTSIAYAVLRPNTAEVTATGRSDPSSAATADVPAEFKERKPRLAHFIARRGAPLWSKLPKDSSISVCRELDRRPLQPGS